MTAQVPDQFFYRDLKLDLVGIRGNELPVPIDFGIETTMASTACWRGYIMRYRIIENKLILEGFLFNSKNNNFPEINGMKHVVLSEDITEEGRGLSSMFEYEYRSLNKLIEFNGSLWLAKDFINSEYVHMGFQSPTAYKTVLKFDFEKGIIINVEDKSKEVEKARKKGTCKESQPKSMSPEDLNEWIMKRFSLNLDYYNEKQNGVK